ncbi:unnamed protein product [Acanthoscelides obtectus]|uniref:Lipase domain-containing protein n=1 Tax=Acanthoscelides obtectus TaxID=200917 RepID=A0A9P0LPY0_ACAOB|nr:unnamed protein product [Acanthoscelides obtectus]CAK1621684.1 Lipoprotein lipase [Acanthoscelides obtectus]
MTGVFCYTCAKRFSYVRNIYYIRFAPITIVNYMRIIIPVYSLISRATFCANMSGSSDKGRVLTREERFSYQNVDFKLADAVKTDVIYKYFRDASTEEPKVLTEETVGDEHMDKTVPTTYIIHGFTTDDSSPWYKPFKDELFKLGPHNVIYINWQKAGNKSYSVSSANIDPVGKYIAQFILASGVLPEKVHIVGHSLGSQLAGFIGKWVQKLSGKKIGRITGLDPAGPRFDYPEAPPTNRLCDTDADFVDVIHTDIQHYGYTPPLGHVDFYPNGGMDQPGCPPRQIDVKCNHGRAVRYFIESMYIQAKAKEANFIEANDYYVQINVKNNPKEVIFGYFAERSSRGVFYLETKSSVPYLIV